MDLVESFVGGFRIMEILDKTLKYYANQILDDFKKSDILKKIIVEAKELNCKISVKCGKSVNLKDDNIYLGIIFCEENDKPLEIFDEGEMSTSICIVKVDNKSRYYFSHWEQDDFIEDIMLIINKIKSEKK